MLLPLITLILIILGINFLIKIRSSKYKGIKGESIIAKYLAKLPENEYKIFNNIYLKVGDSTVQIDHLVISIYGIFVIETKNYSGWIFGDENQDFWTQVIYNNKYKFNNPVKQNKSHINSLKYLLKEYKDLKYYSIIIFVGSAELKSINSFTPVIYTNKLYNYVLRSKEEQILNSVEMINIALEINKNIIKNENIEKIHVENIYKNIERNNLKLNSLVCPKCNGLLVLRNGSFGKFYGCSNYPHCKFTRQF